jgi:glucose-1-phosphate cytidylyltransferase
MIEIGSKPILWHILKIYSHFGINDFVICCGYKGYVIKEYFANYFLHTSDVTFDISANSMEVHTRKAEPWRITLVDTGESTLTGGRLRRVREHLGDETFCFTYGDGVADVDINALIAFHRKEGRAATLTAVQPPGRFGSLAFERGRVLSFEEKPQGDGNWINGGFFVLEPSVISALGSSSHCRRWRRLNSYLLITTRASGSPWTPCVTKPYLKIFGRQAVPPGSSGADRNAGFISCAWA